jgi:nondiscriminating glutamyl-tRNA synthetase
MAFMSQIVTRFAPSPTGYLHVGGLRTALYAYLFARQREGKFLLRIEDTDRARFVADGTDNILDSLSWAGVLPDGGVVRDDAGVITHRGETGPYIQSERLPIYRTHVDQLIASGHAYPCFCTPERLEQVRTERMEQKLAPGYDGHCAAIDPALAASRVAAGESHVIRLRMPTDGAVIFEDMIRGPVTFQYADVDDQVIMKSDGFPTYHLAVVVDDHLMEVSHVIRGEEWISSTPKHLYLYEAFGWTPPAFAHLPLLLNPDKSKLSKRQGDVAVLDYRDKGFLPEALVNFVAFLGWNPGTEQEVFTMGELVAAFDLGKVQKAGAVFNQEKLAWFNRQHMLMLSDEAYMEYAQKFIDPEFSKFLTAGILPIMRDRLSTFGELNDLFKTDLAYLATESVALDSAKIAWKQSTATEAIEALKSAMTVIETLSESPTEEEAKAAVWPLAEAATGGRGSVLWPLRYGMTGQQASPDPFTVIMTLGRNRSIERIKYAITCLEHLDTK